MAKKRSKPNAELSAKAIAKAEISAKASFQRKKIISEVVPPDVTRAKVGAWLTLLSPITEWAGLKGDALRFKRELLRVQQEETLVRVASKVREKLSDSEVTHQISRKILVPALEKASLEDADDNVMVDRWASLLASAAQDVKVQPRFVGILEELSGAQAECLERIAFNRWDSFNYPGAMFEDSSLGYSGHEVQREFGRAIERLLSADVQGDLSVHSEYNGQAIADALEKRMIYGFCRPGILLRSCFLTLRDARSEYYEIYDTVRDTGIRPESDLSILESLGLVREVAITCDIVVCSEPAEISFYYWHLTDLGVKFCQVCSTTRIRALEEKGRLSSAKGLRPQHVLWYL